MNVSICLFIVIGCNLWIREVKHEDTGSTGYIGAAIIGLGLFAMILAPIYGPAWSWWTAETGLSILGVSPVWWFLSLGFILILVAFPQWVRHQEGQGKAPILDLGSYGWIGFGAGWWPLWRARSPSSSPLCPGHLPGRDG